MKKNNVNDENPTAVRLVEMAKDRHRKAEKEASKREEESQKKIADLTFQERTLKERIDGGKMQLEAIIVEFEQLERKTKEAILAGLKGKAMTEDDVKSGRITMTEFHQQQMKGTDVEKEATLKTEEDVETLSDAVRSKATDIARLEFELYTVQNNIYGLLTFPVRSLRRSYKELLDMMDYQLGPLTEEGHTSYNLKLQKEHELMLIDKGVSVAGGYTWSNISLEEAFRIRLDPVLPKKHVTSLLEKLNEIEATEKTRVTIAFRPPGSFYPGDAVEVRIEQE